MNFCTKCGSRVTEEMQFCYKCGSNLALEVQSAKTASNEGFAPPPVVRPFKNTNSTKIPDVSPYRMTLESGYTQPDSYSPNKDGYIDPHRDSSKHSRKSRVTEESVVNPVLSSDSSVIELPPPPVIPGRIDTFQNEQKSSGFNFKKLNPFSPAKHFFITLLVVAGVWAGFFFFDDVTGADYTILLDWGISRNGVASRLEYQNIVYSSKGKENPDFVAEISNGTIDLPINKEILKGQKLTVTYIFDNQDMLTNITILIPQLKREDIYTLSKKFGESSSFDPTNSNPTEFTFYKGNSKLWFSVREKSGNVSEALITVSKR